MQTDHPEVILASTSAARAEILSSAGVRFHQRPSTLDESAEIAKLGLAVTPLEIALHLARCKTLNVAEIEPNAVIIGADQVLSFEETILQKPNDLAEARAQLKRLRGKTHFLHSAAAIYYQGKTHAIADTASLTMRDFSDAFLDWYFDTVNETMLTAVGAYHFEGLGIHLFDTIQGDYFTILGLPVMPILGELRRLNVLES